MQSGKLDPTLRRGELKLILQAMGKAPRSAGFHHFIASAEVQSKLPDLLIEREEERKREAMAKGVEYVKEDELNAHHAIKSKLWSELSEDVQVAWKTIAEQSKEKYHLSIDKYVLFYFAKLF